VGGGLSGGKGGRIVRGGGTCPFPSKVRGGSSVGEGRPRALKGPVEETKREGSHDNSKKGGLG